jgi:zinc transport system ATP-binding protein
MSDVSFAYGDMPVLEDVNLKVGPRDLICVVGPNGGGKTTLLRLILGVLKPHKGEVRVFGQSPVQARHRIGFMPQYARHDPQFPVTVMDIVLMGRLERQWGGPYSKDDKMAALSALADVGMIGLAGRLFNALSGGQRQRVLIARALASSPDLLILDEPTSNVDVMVEARFYDILREFNRRMAIIIVSHDLGFVSGIVQKVVCVNRQVAVHPTSEITGELISELYGGDFRMVRHDSRLSEEVKQDE